MPGGARERIWDVSSTYNWMSGFIETFSGVAYHQGSLGACCSAGYFGGNWVLSMDQVGGGLLVVLLGVHGQLSDTPTAA
jgi:hypothetical protein